MSIQDDIFDIANHLKGTEYEEVFWRVCEYFYQIESNYEEIKPIIDNLGNVLSGLAEHLKKKDG